MCGSVALNPGVDKVIIKALPRPRGLQKAFTSYRLRMSTSGQFRTLHTCFLARTAIRSSICVALTAVTSQSAMRVFVCLLWVLAGIPLETHSVGVRKRVKDAEEKSSTPAEHTEVSGAGKRVVCGSG